MSIHIKVIADQCRTALLRDRTARCDVEPRIVVRIDDRSAESDILCALDIDRLLTFSFDEPDPDIMVGFDAVLICLRRACRHSPAIMCRFVPTEESACRFPRFYFRAFVRFHIIVIDDVIIFIFSCTESLISAQVGDLINNVDIGTLRFVSAA